MISSCFLWGLVHKKHFLTGNERGIKMKRKKFIILFALVLIGLTGCATNTDNINKLEESDSIEESKIIEVSEEADDEDYDYENYKEDTDKGETDKFSIKISSDKYTAYINKYIGMNAAAIGYTSIGGERRENVGAANISVVYVTNDGTYVGVDDEDELKNWKVVSQSFEPNTELQMTFEKDSEGNEYSNLIEWQSIDVIDLGVIPVKSSESAPSLISTKSSPDKYTYYIRNYVGKNLASVGYVSLGGDYRDRYGKANIKLSINSDDGSYIEISEIEALKNYVITEQNIEPNTEMTCTFSKDSDGNEYGFVDYQSIKEISLTVHSITD